LSSYYGWSRFVTMRSISRCKIRRDLFTEFGIKSRILYAVRPSALVRTVPEFIWGMSAQRFFLEPTKRDWR
jgi:ribosomal protein L39E